MRMRTLIFSLLLLTAFSAQAAAQDCLSYDTDSVRLTGTISRKTFPGPPNYESIRKGDKPETYWILHLAKPVCTKASADNDAESNVTDIQLILPPKAYARFKKFVDKKDGLVVIGKLMHAITGHHHTPVLMEVKAIGTDDKPVSF